MLLVLYEYYICILAAFVTAAQLGCIDMVRMLIDIGVPVNVPDTGGWTALHAACEAGHGEMVELLLQSGVSVENVTS